MDQHRAQIETKWPIANGTSPSFYTVTRFKLLIDFDIERTLFTKIGCGVIHGYLTCQKIVFAFIIKAEAKRGGGEFKFYALKRLDVKTNS